MWQVFQPLQDIQKISSLYFVISDSLGKILVNVVIFLVKKSVKKVNYILKYRINPGHLNFEIEVSFDQILMSFKRLKDSPQTSDNQEKSWGQ